MENWYLPISIVPGLGLLILSTSNLMVTLSNEINTMIKHSKENTIITRKLVQLKLLNMAMVFFYIAIAFSLISAVINGVSTLERTSLFMSVFAIILALTGLLSLILYSFRAVKIRQNQFKDTLE